MTWNPVVAGIDGSPESCDAATIALNLAAAAQVECHLVHAASPASAIPTPIDPGMDMLTGLNEELIKHIRRSMEAALREHVEPELLEDRELEVRLGVSTWALSEAIDEYQADLLVLGGKHHSTIGRWLGGSTAHHAVRLIEVPIFVTASHPPRPVSRVLIGIDLSQAAEAALRVGQRIATLLNAELRVLHAVEPFPLLANLSLQLDEAAYYLQSEEVFRQIVSEALGSSTADQVVRPGQPVQVLREECATWKADLLVVGTHGRGWIDRALLGSTTNRLLNDLPTSLLVVPGKRM